MLYIHLKYIKSHKQEPTCQQVGSYIYLLLVFFTYTIYSALSGINGESQHSML